MTTNTLSSDPCDTDGLPTRPLDVDVLITQNKTALPEVYEHVYSTRTTAPTDISSKAGINRQTVHRNLRRLVNAGLVVRHDSTTYRLLEPALEPSVVQSITELGSPLRMNLCAFAVDQDRIVVDDVRQGFNLSASNTRNILNALADDGYLVKRESRQEPGVLVYRVTDKGLRALRTLEDLSAFCGRDGETVRHYASGIEGTSFRTAYEVEDVHIISQRGATTVNELLAETDKEEKATRRRLARLADRGLLEETQRQHKNSYRPKPRTRTMIGAIRVLEDQRQLQAWKIRIPEECFDQVPEPFFPEHIFDIFSTLPHAASADLTDEYITKWKTAGLIEGNRSSGFQFVRARDRAD